MYSFLVNFIKPFININYLLHEESVTNIVLRVIYFNLFPPKAAKSRHFVILLCVTPDDFTRQRRATGWESVN